MMYSKKKMFSILGKVCLTCAVVLSIAGCSSSFRRLEKSDVDKAMISQAQQIATNILESQRDGRFEPLGDESTKQMRDALTPEKQKDAYETISGMLGHFKSMEYVETWVPIDGSLLTIYRFRGIFTSPKPTEIRVILDGNGKLAGFWVKPWREGIH